MTISLIPAPQLVRRRPGCFHGADFELVSSDGRRRHLRGVARLAHALAGLAASDAAAVRVIMRPAHAMVRDESAGPARLAAAIAGKGCEAYALAIGAAGVLIAANGRAGAFYAGRTLEQLARHSPRSISWQCGVLHDWPAAPIRSVLLDCRQWARAGTHVRPAYLRSVIERMSACKLNTLVYYDEFSSVRLRSCPELAARGAMSKSEMRALVNHARDRGVEIVPAFNCFGHWSPGMRRHHLDLSEAGQGTNFCSCNPRVKPYLAKILAELCELFPAHRFSPGCDEVEQLGTCPACRKLGEAGSWARHVNMVCRILAKLGRQPFVWTDFFHGAPAHSPRWRVLDLLDPAIELAYWFYAPGMGLPGLREIMRRAPARRLHLYSALNTMENVFPEYQCRLANVEEYARLLDADPALQRRTVTHTACAWSFNCSWAEQTWMGIWRHADLAWQGPRAERRDFLRNFGRTFLGVDTDEISRAIMELAKCNVFDNGGGFPNRLDAVSLMFEVEDLALDRLSRAEIIARIATIPARIRDVNRILTRWDRRVTQNRYFFDCLKLAADRFESFAQRVLLLEECRELYRQAYRLQHHDHWQFEKFRPPDRAGVIRRLRHIQRNMTALRADIPPLRSRIIATWRAGMREPGLKQFHLDRLAAHDNDLRRLADKLENMLREYCRGGRLPPPDRRLIFKSELEFEVKRFI